ncbi:MAG: TIGR04013 family B12-binding domain/radical SAM domain-containing protein [Pseudomonadota bacterium]
MSRSLVFRRSGRNHNALAALAAALESSGGLGDLTVSVVDSLDAVPDDLAVLAYSFLTPDLERVRDEVVELRRLRGQGVVLVAGGAHASADPGGTLALGFDAVFVGEGERSFPAFIQRMLESGEVVRGRIDPGPPIDLDDFDWDDARRGNFPFAEITRGCPHGCAFCQVPVLFGRRMRHRSPAAIARGVARSAGAGHRRFRYLSSDAFAYRGAARDVEKSLTALLDASEAAGARQQLLGNFPAEVRPDRVTPELLALVRARCFNRTLVIGAQSGSDRVLELMHRGHDVETSRLAIALTVEAGLVPHVDILLCFPGEDASEQGATLDLADWCIAVGARVHAHSYIPLPGTPSWPAPPEALTPSTRSRLKGLEQRGALDGYWEQHIGMARKILLWRRRGWIQV